MTATESSATQVVQQGTPKLNEALAKMQSQLSTLKRDRDVTVKSPKGEYEYSYVTLAAIWDAIRKPLTDNGLAVVQLVSTTAQGVAITTRLLHISGESISSTCSMPVTQNTPQGIGGSISYGRRYGLAALVGVVSEDEDDDASAGSGKDAKITPRKAAAPPKTSEVPATKPAASPGGQKAPARDTGAVFPNYGRAKGAPVAGASVQDLEFYRSGCLRSLADPAKANFHAKEKALLAAIDDELSRHQRQTAITNEASDDGIPPPGDEDAPF